MIVSASKGSIDDLYQTVFFSEWLKEKPNNNISYAPFVYVTIFLPSKIRFMTLHHHPI